ncbi:SusC/RagA family TonB-linked outer membrane protein [Sphingobacterium kitahiroshimense]|uniref:SusC/RagA family TonB-linked outer membrane protein n=1 Tax=Sphingobacterium kitahiroshimense TaxID=470446 RepID=A0ABV0BQD8_9SPHI
MNKFLLFVVFSCVQLTSFAQETITLKGKVLDSKTQTPILGATVFIESTAVGESTGVVGQIQQSALGAVTDNAGNFTLTVPTDVKYFTVSFVGYQNKQVQVAKVYNTIFLEATDKALEEVIVTGYTNISKVKNTTAYNKLKLDDIKQTGVSSVDQLLEGQVAGLQLSNLNGGPNSAPKIRIRGTVSLNGTQDPLWVIDGLPIEGTALPNTFDKDNLNNLSNLPIAGINPDDIADITVLKDAAATSIYGARAANGVIVITTKKGKKGPTQVSVSANSFVTQKPDFTKLNLMNASEKVEFELGMANRSDLTYRTNQGAIARLLSANNELDSYRKFGITGLSKTTQDAISQLRSQSHNWGDELYRTALNQQYTAAISGGSDGHDFYLSGGFYDEQAATKGVGMRRYSLTLNNNFKISNKLKAGINLLGSSTDRNNFIQDRDAFTNPNTYARTVNPYLTPRDAQGNYVYDQDIVGYERDTYIPFNALEERANTNYNLNNKSLKAIANLTYQILPSLSLRTELGLQFEESGTERFADKESYNTRKFRAQTRYYDSASKTNKYFLPDGGQIQNDKNSIFQYNWKSFAQYNLKFDDHHDIEIMAGTELRRSKNTGIMTRGFGYNPKTLTTQPILFPSSNYATDKKYQQYVKTIGESSYASFYANASYSYDRKYNIYGSIRYDGSNMFGVDPKYRFLPIWSLSGSWNAKEEDFLKDQEWVSNLKFRGSYGIQGNIDRNSYPFIIGTYSNGSMLPGNNEESIVVDMPANDKLRWERTQSWNAGFDFGILKNRVQFTVDYYNRLSTDLIGTSQLPLENGFPNVSRNWASVSNDGIEFSVNSQNIVRDRFSWSTDFNIAHNRNKLKRVMADPTAYNVDARAGNPINAMYEIETAGLDADGLPQFYNDQGAVVSYEDYFQLFDPYADMAPGLFVNSSMNNNEYQNKFKYKGSMDPKFVGGMTNRFRYANFDLAVSVVFNIDQWMRRSPTYNPAIVDRGSNYTKDVLQALTPGSKDFIAIGSTSAEASDRWMAYSWMDGNDPSNAFKYLDIWSKKMSYLRVNSIRLGYTLPKSVANKIQASNIRFNIEGRNLFVFGNNYDGYFDPETFGNNYAQPISKSFAFGLTASF